MSIYNYAVFITINIEVEFISSRYNIIYIYNDIQM